MSNLLQRLGRVRRGPSSLKRAINKLRKYGTNYREFVIGKTYHCSAVVSGRKIGFFILDSMMEKPSATLHYDEGASGPSFSGKSLSATIKWCQANPVDKPKPVGVVSLAGPRSIFLEM